MKIKELVQDVIKEVGTDLTYAELMTIIITETPGKGFDAKTGKILIQFEPVWFSRLAKLPRSKENSHIWDENGVSVQSVEWIAFNDAFKLNRIAAMEATSIGLPQILGLHWKRLGFNSVGDFWDYMKLGEREQVKMLIRFIETDKKLHTAVKKRDWHMVAVIYNGPKYKQLALDLKREPYNITVAKNFAKLSEEKVG